ncbi:hypothetical protein PAPYR_8121 [Paratrimastix pyriformis]|uniref:Secreted protein n=1 Tax=Paratrimastix pyriformis TaxID=342808 RepID=A0ABQ8UCY1_9EUKA|nr:hypothetical protein PAPYR_8121 [Paratrimastix pyriformis]
MKEQPFILSRTIFRFFFISLRYLFSGLHILPCREIAKAKAVERYQAEIMSLFTRGRENSVFNLWLKFQILAVEPHEMKLRIQRHFTTVII